MTIKHLWEVDHPYYCSKSNYYSNDCNTQYKSWQDYFNEMNGYPIDLNLVFRFDWMRNNQEDHPPRDEEGFRLHLEGVSEMPDDSVIVARGLTVESAKSLANSLQRILSGAAE